MSLAAVSCTKVHNVTGNKYKFAQTVQEPVAIGYKFGHSLNKTFTCYSRWCCTSKTQFSVLCIKQLKELSELLDNGSQYRLQNPKCKGIWRPYQKPPLLQSMSMSSFIKVAMISSGYRFLAIYRLQQMLSLLYSNLK